MTLLVTSAPNQPLVRDGSLQDAAKFIELVASLPLTDTPSNWAVTFDGIQAALSTAIYSDKEVVLITDMRRSGWSKDVTRAANDLAAGRVPLRIIDVGDRRTDNVALLKFALEDALPLPNQPIHLAAEIRNHTAAAIKGAQATLNVDGNSRPVLLPELPPGASTNVPLTLTLDMPGPHDVSLALAKDLLPGDDVRYLSIDVRPDGLRVAHRRCAFGPEVRVGDRFSGAGLFGRRSALECRTGLAVRSAEFSARCGRCSGRAGAWRTSLRCRPSRSPRFERLVEHGMGLMIFSGDLVDVDIYNERLYRDGRGLLPAKLDRPAETPTTGLVVEKDPQSPLAPLAKLVPEALARIHAKQYTTVRLGSTPPEGVSVLARWNNAENPPAVLQKVVGKGRVLFFTCTAGKKWSDWPIDKTYLLAMRSAALAIARSQDRGGSLSAGEPIRLVLDADQAALDPKIAPPGKRPPEPVEISKPSANSTLLQYTKTMHAGIYLLTWRDEKTNARSLRFAVNPPPAESDLEPLGEEQLIELLGNLKPTIQRYDTSGASLDTPPREIWRPLATILLGLLGLEAVFAVWVGRER